MRRHVNREPLAQAVDTPLHSLSASAAVAAIARGDIRCVALLEACLDRIESRDALVCAWAHLAVEPALAAARDADLQRDTGKPLGALHGVPIAIKDIFDTADMPTECGSRLHLGRRPARDARAVALLRDAGAIILGKTVTAELALSAPGPTANPLDPRRTPGGSSSGSAAAVADAMAPLAVGSQTTGSVIRPASYCGILGFKPSLAAVPTAGMHILAEPLDHVGVFARELADIVLITRVLTGADAGGNAPIRGRAREPLRVGVVRAPVWREASSDARAAFDAWAQNLGLDRPVELGEIFDDAVACQRLILDFNLAANLSEASDTNPGGLRAQTRSRIDNGRHIGTDAYRRALTRVDAQRAHLSRVFQDHDLLVTLAAPGEAPVGHSTTGNAVFSAIWTLMGVPALTLPLLEGENALPIGVQLIGAMGTDAAFLAAAAQFLEMPAAGGA